MSDPASPFHRNHCDSIETPLRNATVINGDARDAIQWLHDDSVQCVITSPPYWGVRDYGVTSQIGLEPTLTEYLDQIVEIFDKLRRILKSSGVVWINIGDVYASGNRKYRAPDKKYPQRALATRPDTPEGLKRKDLIGIPWRIAFALQQRGWYLRTEVIWHKINAMPESVRDRPWRSHEYLFLFSKSERYKFFPSALQKERGAARRSVWCIPTARSKTKGHHAVFPEAVVRPCINSTTKAGDIILDPFCGTGTVGVVCLAEKRRFIGIELNSHYARFAVKRLGSGAAWIKAGQQNGAMHPKV